MKRKYNEKKRITINGDKNYVRIRNKLENHKTIVQNCL